jgi:hypothetical protein
MEEDVPEAPARTRAAAIALFDPLLADLGGPTREALRTLMILPGPVGTRHAWTLVGLVDDEAPLHRAAAVREALQGHMGMLPRRALAGGTSPAAPVVLTESTFEAMLHGRLFRRPLRRLAIRLHRIVLFGPDPASSPAGLDASDDDRRTEIAALIEATSTAWRARSAVTTEDLVFGAWPAAIHHAGYGDPHACQASILGALARRTDPALARVGSAADRRPWGDLEAGDLGRPDGFLRDWGPALIRLQEVAVESSL